MKNMFLIPSIILVGGAVFTTLFKIQQNDTASGISLLFTIIGGVWLAIDVLARINTPARTTDSQK